jgi:hypothetical protein
MPQMLKMSMECEAQSSLMLRIGPDRLLVTGGGAQIDRKEADRVC